MGLIQRQSIKYSAVSFLSVFVGGLSVIFIYPNDRETYGLLQYIISFAMLLMPLIGMGIHSLVVRFFPEFKDKKQQHRGFLGFILLFSSFALVTSSIFFFFFQEYFYALLQLLNFDISIIRRYRLLVFALAAVLLLNKIFTNYISVFGRIVVPNILNNFLIKLLMPILILLHLFGWVVVDQLILLLLAGYTLALVILILYTIKLGEFYIRPKLSYLKPALQQKMRTYAFYALLVGSAPILAQHIDSFMVTTLVSAEQNGDYTIFRFMANTIDIPLFALIAIGGPIVAAKFEEQDLIGIKGLYQKSALNGLIAGSLIFIGVFCNLDDLLQITGKYAELSPLKSVFLFLGIAKLFDVVTSLNAQIIGYSKYFRFNFWLMLFLAVINVINNYLFIEYLNFNAIGAAIATCISIFLFNILRLLFIWWRFKMIPFTKEVFLVIGLAVLLIALTIQLPLNISPIVNIILRSIFIVATYTFVILYFRISEDVNALALKYWQIFQKN